MNVPTALCCGLACAALLAPSATAAPKVPDPAPAAEQAAPKKGVFGKLKGMVGLGKKEEPSPAKATPAVTKEKAKPSPAPAAKPAAKQDEKPAAKAKSEAPPPAAGGKKGFLRGMFGGKSKSGNAGTKEADGAPELARAKTAKPAPVKEMKPAAPATAAAAPPKKRGLFGFLRGSGGGKPRTEDGDIPEDAKLERPADWKDHSVVMDDYLPLYTFGPSQANPDELLKRGTLVKVARVTKGWAFVEVPDGPPGYVDAASLRHAEKADFKDPAPAVASVSPNYWAPGAPPPDLPEQPSPAETDPALMLLPPLELEPKP